MLMRILVMILFGAITFASCKEKREGESRLPVNPPDSIISLPHHVPDSIRTLFDQQYPGVSTVNWRFHGDGGPIDRELAGWAPGDSNSYSVSFTRDSTEHWAWYHNSGWVGTAMEVKDRDNLPAAVRHTVRQRYPGYTLVASHKEYSKAGIAFQCELSRNGKAKKVLIDSTGIVIREKP